MNVLVTGSSGLVGSALIPSLSAAGHSVTRLVRPTPSRSKVLNWKPSAGAGGVVMWDPEGGPLDPAALEGIDAVVHLAGESINGRWTAQKKVAIRESRIRSTHLLVEAMGRMEHPPAVLVSSSAIGYYGDRGDEILTEESVPGRGFLAEVCKEWESESDAAAQFGVRVAVLRTAMVLSTAGGALGSMLLPFRLGVGGKMGSGRQYMSWIAIDDLVGAILHALITRELSGPVNASAPNPVRNAEFTRALGKAVGRPTFFTVPEFVVKLALGEMGEELLLASTRVEPKRLQGCGFVFHYPEVEGALLELLG